MQEVDFLTFAIYIKLDNRSMEMLKFTFQRSVFSSPPAADDDPHRAE